LQVVSAVDAARLIAADHGAIAESGAHDQPIHGSW